MRQVSGPRAGRHARVHGRSNRKGSVDGQVLFVRESYVDTSAFYDRIHRLEFPIIDARSIKAVLDHLLHDNSINVVVSALHQKGQGGIHLLAKARHLGVRLPFLFLPSTGQGELVNQAAKYRFVQFLGQGLTDTEFHDIVKVTYDVGGLVRGLDQGLKGICAASHFPAEKSRELLRLQNQFFEGVFENLLHPVKRKAA